MNKKEHQALQCNELQMKCYVVLFLHALSYLYNLFVDLTAMFKLHARLISTFCVCHVTIFLAHLWAFHCTFQSLFF